MSSPDVPRRSRVDADGLAYAGSMLQTQIYVNEPALRRTLESKILDELPDLAELRPRFDWRSPLKDEAYAEYHDAGFLRAIGCSDNAPDLARFWPMRGGPHWDALARLDFGHDDWGVLLVEGK